MNQCWCEPGWESKLQNGSIITFPGLMDCSSPILDIGVGKTSCDCEPSDTQRSFLKNSSWFHSFGYRCHALCLSNSQIGMPISHAIEWRDNQIVKQLGFYAKDLPKRRHTHMRERLDEFSKAFDHWQYLNDTNFGSVIEFGVGGYTQLRNIMEHIHIQVSDITLVDPLIYHYKDIQGCSYFTGNLKVNDIEYKSTLSNSTVEMFGQHPDFANKQYDTVIVMNVLVYAQNAFNYLNSVYNAVKPGGILIFHDRYFSDLAASSLCKTAGFYVNVLQVSKVLLEHFLSAFPEKVFFSTNQTEGQKMRSRDWCGGRDDERGFFVVLKKPKA